MAHANTSKGKGVEASTAKVAGSLDRTKQAGNKGVSTKKRPQS